MSFNVSRFLVHVRQFWTRERLVPVLGVTAMFMFGLLWQHYLSSLFEDKPIIARHIVINGETVQGDDFRAFTQDQEDAHRFHFEFEFDDESKKKHKHRRHRHHHKRFKVWHNGEHFEHELEEEIERELENLEKELQLELEKVEEELQELEVERRVLKFKTGDDDEDIIILHNGADDGAVEITINGKKLEIKSDNSI